MNEDKPEKTDKECNVCDTGVVEVGSAWSRCSNRNCPTRDRDNNLSTDATAEELAEYWADLAASDENARYAVKEPHQALVEKFPRVSARSDD